MSDIFGGIFDGLGDDVDSLFSSNVTGSLLSSGAKALAGQAGKAGQAVNSDEYRAQREVGMVDQGVKQPLGEWNNQVALHYRDQSQQVDSVDPMTLEQQWNERLQRYAGVQRATGVSQGGR